MDKSDMDLVTAITEGPWTVEANDISCVGLLHRRDHVIGPFANVYNEGTLRYLADAGATWAATAAASSVARTRTA